MSARDYAENSAELPALVGRKCFVTLATNSVKLHIDRDQKGGTFLWIDPPWQFGRGEELIESSASCPHYEEERYEERFREWGRHFKPVRESVIEKIDASPDGGLRIGLADGFTFLIPSDFIPEDDPWWYDHWYVRKEANQPVQTGRQVGLSDLNR